MDAETERTISPRDIPFEAYMRWHSHDQPSCTSRGLVGMTEDGWACIGCGWTVRVPSQTIVTERPPDTIQWVLIADPADLAARLR